MQKGRVGPSRNPARVPMRGVSYTAGSVTQSVGWQFTRRRRTRRNMPVIFEKQLTDVLITKLTGGAEYARIPI
ncbi:hypothetical protein KJ693_00125 [bacterium]|nr:hypothetical protein [bacterium]